MNCIIIEDNHLSRFLIEGYINKVDNLNLLYSFSNAIEALNKLKTISHKVDIIFLDVELPEMNGFEFLKVLHNYPQIIIISAFEKYALSSYDYIITDYLLKPVSFERFLKAVEKAYILKESSVKVKSENDDSATTLYIKSNQAVVRLKYDDIIFVQGLENYVTIYTKENNHTILSTMKGMEDKFSGNVFKRVHRSFIVNMNKIQKIQNGKIVVISDEGQHQIPIGKKYKKSVMDNLSVLKRDYKYTPVSKTK